MTPAMAYAAPGIIEVDLDGTPVNIDYDVDGVEILDVEVDIEFVSVIFDIEVTGSPGIFEVTLDRNFLDSVFDGIDDPFIVIFDGGEEPNFEEISTTAESRTLRIELPNGSTDVEILGTAFGDGGTTELVEDLTIEEPVEEPEVEEPEVIEEPEVEEPEVIEEPIVEQETEEPTTQPTQCGPGTILKDGACVLDQSCGPGTILQDGVCVLDVAEKKPVGNSRDLAMGIGAAFVIAFIAMIILWLIGKAGKDRSANKI